MKRNVASAGWLAAALLAVLLAASAPAAAVVANLSHVSDGRGDEWAAFDLIATGSLSPSAGGAWDLTGLSADDNASSWFFAVNYSSLAPATNSTMALYLMGPASGIQSAVDPRGWNLTLPTGLPLVYALYFDLNGALPGTSSVWFFDGITWKNRTFAELGISAARNDSVGLIEMAAPRGGLPFLTQGSVAAVFFDPIRAAVDAVPDLNGPGRLTEAAPLFDYTNHPPLVFTALGFSDPGAAQGQTIGIYLELTNAGPKPLSGVSATVFIDGNPLGSKEGLTLLGANGTTVLAFNWTAQEGTHNVSATSYPGGSTRTISATFAGASALLVVERAEPSPATPVPGQDFHVLITVRNVGEADSLPARILLKESTYVISMTEIPALGPGESVNATLGANYDRAGAHLLRVEVDGIHTDGASRVFDVTVMNSAGPFGIDLVILAAIAVVGAGAAMWFVTPRLLKERPRDEEPDERP